MACRLFRELKLDILVKPTAEGTISKIINRDMGTSPPQRSVHAYALHTINEGDVNYGVSGNNIYLGEDIELEERGCSTTCE
jgi:hypothetical protein